MFFGFFGTSLDDFIDKLEGVYRPIELVPAYFLKYSVQLSLKRFFREDSTVRGLALHSH